MIGDVRDPSAAAAVTPILRRPTSARTAGALLAVATIGAVLALVWLGLDLTSWPDWTIEALPGVSALLGGHLVGFLRDAPPYGGSLLLRAPFMALPRFWHGGAMAVYRAGALPCIAALAVLGLWLARDLARRGCGLVAQTLTVVLCVANPLTVPALQIGHPEELLGAGLCVAAVLCAQRGHPTLSGVLVGLAVANKPWGVLAAGPVLLALPRDRGRALAAMAIVAGVLLAPFVIARTGGVEGELAGAGGSAADIFNPWQLWWFLGAHRTGARGSLRTEPGWLGPLGHTLPIALMPPLTVLTAVRARARRDPVDALLLLTLLLLLRCALDPWDISYYAIPCLTALLAWETTTRDRVPLVSLVAIALGWFVLQETTALLGDADDVLALLYTAAAVPAIAVLGDRVIRGCEPTGGRSIGLAARRRGLRTG